MSIHRAVLIHVFNGKEKAVHIGPHPCPKTTGSKLGAFLRSISDAQIEGMIEKLEGLEWWVGSIVSSSKAFPVG